VFSPAGWEKTQNQFYYFAGINSKTFAGGHTHCGSGTHVAGARGNGQKYSGSGLKKTVLRRALTGCSYGD